MTAVALRIFLFTFLPILMGGLVILVDRASSSRERRLEAVLIFLFAIGVAGNGIFSFFGHFFLSDVVAASIGWEPGSPFQLEMGFANLAMGALGLVATSRREGFREATVIAVTVLGVGATIVHLMDIAATGNLAPGNSLQNVGNLVKPALLISFLLASRRAEQAPGSEVGTYEFERWRTPLLQASGPVTASIATGYGLGFGLDQLWLLTLLGVLLAVGMLVAILRRATRLRSALGRS